MVQNVVNKYNLKKDSIFISSSHFKKSSCVKKSSSFISVIISLQLIQPAYVLAAEEIKTDAITITAPVVVPDLGINKEQSTSNVKLITSKQLEKRQNSGIAEYLNERMQSVTANDYAGNPFQMDVNFRGFTASSLLGTPQGLSIYLDGARMNDAFGDVVAWDLFPMNAMESIALVPGSNPLFGLNTIGGALAMRTKSGFSNQGGNLKLTYGSWDRAQLEGSYGVSNDKVAVFVAFNQFDENGWRDFSPTKVNQLFGKLETQLGSFNAALSVLKADNTLVGNGLTPKELLVKDGDTAIFTAPDRTESDTNHINFTAGFQFNDAHRAELVSYYRDLKRNTVNGDFNDDFGDLEFDGSKSGAFDPGTGTVAGAPIGVLNKTNTRTNNHGVSINYTWDIEKNHFLLGVARDFTDVYYTSSQRYGTLDAQRRVQQADISAFPNTSKFDILLNRLKGESLVSSAYFSDTWSAIPNLHLTLSGRYVEARVANTLKSNKQRLFDGNQDPGVPADQVLDYREKSEAFSYHHFNPAIGASWSITPQLNLFGSVTQGNRIPSALELGCANPAVPCRVPSALTDDPYLKQVIATTQEVGMRGTFDKHLSWNAAVFKTDLKDDILFVGSPVSNQLGYFTNFGQTRREGIELGAVFNADKCDLNISYTYLNSTYQSAARLRNNSNSTSQFTPSTIGKVSERFSYAVNPGDHIPGLPNHQLKAEFDYHVTPKFDVGINMNMFSFSYVRGNENNKHEPGSVTETTGPFAGKTRTFLNAGKVPGYAVFHLQARYNPTKKITLFAKVNNIFNRDYYTAGSLVQNPFSPSTQGAIGVSGFNHNSQEWQRTTAYTPGAPRAGWVGISLGF